MQQRQYVGIDLHRRRSVFVRKNADGDKLATVHVENSPEAFADALAEAGEDPEVILEATYGWYWAADVLAELGTSVHLAHPLGLNWGQRRRKDDEADAEDLADMCRLGRLPEAWIAPPPTRELRELVRYRAKLVAFRSSCKNQTAGVLAKCGVHVPMTDLFGIGGRELIDTIGLDSAYRMRVDSLVEFVDLFDAEVHTFDVEIRRRLGEDAGWNAGWNAVQAIPGVGPVLGAVFIAEIGDITRFSTARQLCSWAGLTPKHHESDTTVHRGHITKQGSRIVRWAAVEASQRTGEFLKSDYRRIAERRNNKGIAKVAVARKIVTLVYYGMRDGHIRCLAPTG